MSAQDSSPTFCVVLPTRDRADRVAAAIERLRRIDGAPEQIVVVDDGSQDDTIDRLGALDPPVWTVVADGDGPATARNLGVAAATTEWLVFLDDDDDPHDDWMTSFREMVRSRPSASYVSVGFDRDVGGRITPVSLLETSPAFGEVPANFIAGTFAVRRSAFLEAGGFMDGLRCMEFTDLALRLLGSIVAGDAIVHDASSHPITIHVRPPSERVSQSAEVLEAAWHAVRERNTERWALDPRFAANQCSTVGVAWLRQGRAARGRRWLWTALRTRPTTRDAARLVISALPPLRRRVWPIAPA